MHIKKLYEIKKTSNLFRGISPKQESSVETVTGVLSGMAKQKPATQASLTAREGGNNSDHRAIASHIKNELGTEPMAHLTCIGATKPQIAPF